MEYSYCVLVWVMGLCNMVSIEELRTLVEDRYTAAEVVEILGITTEELLDSFMNEVYTNSKDFEELRLELGEDDEEKQENPVWG